MTIHDLMTHGLCLLGGIFFGWLIAAASIRFWQKVAWDAMLRAAKSDKGKGEHHGID